MRITPHTTTTISFKGYDARKLSGLLMNSNYCSIAEEMLEIAKKEELPQRQALVQTKNRP